ncbi:MAG: hypothetical protein WC674_11210, partial [Candidatus Krumholzibacteriia bacterium]
MPEKSGASGFVPRRTIYIVLFLLCLAAYRGILDNRLFNDDFSWLKAARHDMTPANLIAFRVVDFFRPLVNLSFYIMEKASPGNVPLHYAFNLALHFLCATLVFQLILKLLGSERLAAAAAVLFAVTSVHSAAVMWISARTTLLAACFLLASLNVLLARAGKAPLRLAVSVALYVLALASKEEAIAGLLLVALLFALKRKGATSGSPDRNAFAAFAVVSIAYLVLRQAFMGGFFQENWGLGTHAPRNVAGGFLFQLYPWPLFSLFYPKGNYIPEPSTSLGPELAAIPVALALVAAGYASRKSYAMNLAVGWSLLALLPVSFFRYRFFSTVSISQDRYYYLSSVGTALIIALLLSMLWKERSRARQAAAIALFAVLCAGFLVRDARLERKWNDFTRMYREVVTAIVEESDAFTGFTKLAVEGSPLAFPYLADAIALERPGRTAFEVT